MELSFVVNRPPFGKQRPRFSSRTGRTYTPSETTSEEIIYRQEYLRKFQGIMLQGMIGLKVIAYYEIPKSINKKNRQMMIDGDIRPVKRPDIDNILKLVADSLNGIAFHDDAQMVEVSCEKWYSEQPRVEVTVYEVEDNSDQN